jgi:hypothetical protein
LIPLMFKTCNSERSRSALSGYSVEFRMNKFSDISNVIKCGIRRKILVGNENHVSEMQFKKHRIRHIGTIPNIAIFDNYKESIHENITPFVNFEWTERSKYDTDRLFIK